MDEDWQRYRKLGEQATAAGQFGQSEAMWTMAALIAEEFGEKDPRLCYCLDSLSHALLRQGKYRLAEVFLSRCWRLKSKVNASKLELARTLNMVAEVFYHQQRFAEAENMCRRVLEVYEVSYGKEHPSTKVAADNLVLLEKVTREHAQKAPASDAKPTAPPPEPAAKTEKPAPPGTAAASEAAPQARAVRIHEETGKMSAIPDHLVAPPSRTHDKGPPKSIFTESGTGIKTVPKPGSPQTNVARQEVSQTNRAVPSPANQGSPGINIAAQAASQTNAAVPAPSQQPLRAHQDTGKIIQPQVATPRAPMSGAPDGPRPAGLQPPATNVPRPAAPALQGAQQPTPRPLEPAGTGVSLPPIASPQAPPVAPRPAPAPTQAPQPPGGVRAPQGTPNSQSAAVVRPQPPGMPAPAVPAANPRTTGGMAAQAPRPAAPAPASNTPPGLMNLPLAKPPQASSTALPPVMSNPPSAAAPSTAPIAPTRGAKKLDSSRPKCEVCGYDLDGEYCQRCTGTGLRPIRPDERLGGYF